MKPSPTTSLTGSADPLDGSVDGDDAEAPADGVVDGDAPAVLQAATTRASNRTERERERDGTVTSKLG